jgi:hypothetical protein
MKVDMQEELNPSACEVAIIGGGPAGLMAAQRLSAAGVQVQLFDAMASVGRKFLLAGRGGLNLTHSENADAFAGRYGSRRSLISATLADMDGPAVRRWAQDLGVSTFVGSSGRVFPTDMKAAPLLRAWLQRLRHPQTGVPVQFFMRHRWIGWDTRGALLFECAQGTRAVRARAVLLALGGGSWARLGSDGSWVALLAARGVAVAPLHPSNCGFDVAGAWSPFFADRFAGQALKSVAIRIAGEDQAAPVFDRKGEFVITQSGVEGSLIYAASPYLRDALTRTGQAQFYLDLLPALSSERVLAEVAHPRGTRSLSSHLKSRLRLDGVKSALLRECLPAETFAQPQMLAAAIKAVPIRLQAARPLDEAISSAGGVLFEVLTPQLMLEQMPGVFCAGEMLDWEAPTGGYLLTACLATGHTAAQGILRFLGAKG